MTILLSRIKSFSNHFRTILGITKPNTFIYGSPTKYNSVLTPTNEKEKCLLCYSSNKCPFNSHYPCYPNK